MKDWKHIQYMWAVGWTKCGRKKFPKISTHGAPSLDVFRGYMLRHRPVGTDIQYVKVTIEPMPEQHIVKK